MSIEDIDNACRLLSDGQTQQIINDYASLRLPDPLETATLARTPDEQIRLVPEEIGPYRLIRPLGRGGMGVVFLAEHQMLGTRRALKLIAPHLAGSPRIVNRFRNEIRAHGHLESIDPAFVTALEAHEYDGTLYLVTEVISGCDLSRLIARIGPLPSPVACDLVMQVCTAMAAAHQLGMVHRDLKPSNLMLTATGMLRILDLGLAILGETLTTLSATETRDTAKQGDTGEDSPVSAAGDRSVSFGHLVGTPDFMAPEQLARPQNASPAADLYSIGVTLFACLTGTTPGRIAAESSGSVEAGGGDRGAVSPDERLPPGTPAGVRVLIRDLLEHDPQRRPRSAQAVAERLRAFASHDETRRLLAQFDIASPPSTWPEEIETGLNSSVSGLRRNVAIKRLKVLAVAACMTASILLTPLVQMVRSFTGGAFPLSSLDLTSSLGLPDQQMTKGVTPTDRHTIDGSAEAGHSGKEVPSTSPGVHAGTGPGGPDWTLTPLSQAIHPEPLDEPPSLDDWLLGRRVLTVKQDGTAQYRSIFSASRAMKPNDVIEILDSGPYIENLHNLVMPAGSAIVSRAGTVILPAQWITSGSQPLPLKMHSIKAQHDCRLSGLYFHWPATPDSMPLEVYADGTFVIEHCSFTESPLETDSTSGPGPLIQLADQVGAMEDAMPASLWVRDCVLCSRLTGFVRSPVHKAGSTVTLTRNLFCSENPYSRLMYNVASQGESRSVLRVCRNAFHCREKPLHFLCVGISDSVAGHVVCDHNSFAVAGATPIINRGQASAGCDFTLQFNHCLVSSQPLAWSLVDIAPDWAVEANLVPSRHSRIDDSANVVFPVQVPLDATRPDYLRISINSPLGKELSVPGSEHIPGALSLHSSGRPDDWFDHLRLRWCSQTELHRTFASLLESL